MARISDEVLLATVEAVTRLGSKLEAAKELQVGYTTLRDRMDTAVRRGLTGDTFGTVPEGYKVGKITRLQGPAGKMMEWQHLQPEQEQIERALDQWVLAGEARVTPMQPSHPEMMHTMQDKLAVYPLPDVHFGQHSWGKETGEDYDIALAGKAMRETVTRLMRTTAPASEALIINLGDYLHADNNNAVTERSGAHLDVDSRFDKVIYAGAELQLWMIDHSLLHHDHVTVWLIPGNHDPYAMKALEMMLWYRYQNEPRVTIERGPDPYRFLKFGRSMIMAHHGHLTPPEKSPGIMAALRPQMWGETDFRYAYMGHFHRRKNGPIADEQYGAQYEVFQALTAKDAWNHEMGHTSGRGLTSILHDINEGEIARVHRPVLLGV